MKSQVDLLHCSLLIMKILLVLLQLSYLVNCANILVLECVPSPSHHVWMKTLTYALASKGHNITAISADIEEDTPENLHYLHLDKVYEVIYDGSGDINYVELGKANSVMQSLIFVTVSKRSLEGIVISKGYKQLLDYPDDFKFDLIIYDFVLGPLLLPFATKFPSTPIIGATAYSSSGFSIPVLGGTFTPAFIPSLFYPSQLETFQDRMNNFVLTYFDYLIRIYYIAPRTHKVLGHDFPNMKDVRELDKSVKFVLINKDPVLSIQEQSLPNVISVGGMQIQRANALPKDLQTILDEAKKGVILFSLGTNIMGSMVKSERFTEILEAFRSLSEYTIIFKMDPEKIPGRLPSNVVVRSWLPQNDILAHPNLKLFITHCGLLSVQEALWHGVPMLGIPIFADGFDNIRLLAKQGIAEQQDIMQIERHSLQQVMKKILDDPKYWNNAQALSRIFKDQKETPLERAIWWTEFVLRNPNSTHMRSQSLDQGVFIRHSWDVLAFFSALFLIFLFCISKLVCLIFRRIAKKKSAKKKREQFWTIILRSDNKLRHLIKIYYYTIIIWHDNASSRVVQGHKNAKSFENPSVGEILPSCNHRSIAKMKFILILSVLPCFISAANILVLETVASPSHHIWIRTLMHALVDKGHNVTSLSADIDTNPPKNLHYLHLDKVYETIYDDSSEDHSQDIDFLEMGKMNPYLAYHMFMSYCTQSLQGIVKSTGYRQLLNYPDNYKFDLIINDFVVGPFLVKFVDKFGNPPLISATAFYSSGFANHIFGGVLTPSFVPYPFMEVDLTTFLGRANNYLLIFLDQFIRKYYIAPKVNSMMKEDFPNAQDAAKIEERTKIVLINKHPALDIIEPLMPNVISVGGLQIARTKGLSKEFQEVMDNAKNGAILFSLGTNMKSEMLGNARQIEILEAFRALPQYTFIWKFETDSLPVEVPSNVLIKKFVPQSDLLAHPNMKLFISHCGLLSTQESVWFGVPILGLPVFADQFHNLKLSLKTGVALQGDVVNIERHSFRKLIEHMITDPKYRENAQIRSNIFRDEKDSPLERAVWWVEYVLRHPNMTHMRSPSLDLNLFQRHSWDVQAFFLVILSAVLIVTLKISCCIYKCFFKQKSRKSKKD
ncbi:uncharacterized protein LOC132259179 [Phlebotomus argentipes]|uniref:uncharacterized protein LOC132259179 n=1 Tax=Phlebotomus argentipes TaxID=94469 RepID=UPI00289311CF|nr:uncharacterized protein LOC132259179 [Phlebotomus argentipes]